MGANSTVCASPSVRVDTADWFDSTSQPAGAVTATVIAAFMSGCSKQAMNRRASAGSSCVYR